MTSICCRFYSERVIRSALGTGDQFQFVSGTAYFIYLGFTRGDVITPKFLEFNVLTSGTGAVQRAEVGLFSTPLPPNKNDQTLTKILAKSPIDSLLTVGVKRNTVPNTVPIEPLIFLWAGIRVAMTTTQPTVRGLNDDMAQGFVLVTPAAGSLLLNDTFAGTIVAATGNTVPGPDLRATLD